MPNYRKNKPNKSNRNKHKNKSQNPNPDPNQKDKSNTESSSVEQELSKSESVGIVPILPADVINSRIGSTSFASEINKDISDLLVGDSSPSSNEEIVQIATHTDIDTSSRDANTVLIQSNYSSSFSSSTFKKSTEIEEISGRTVFEGDSALGNSSIIDSFVDESGIISSKTGSANTKDAAVPTASKSAKKSKETAKITDENRSDSQNVQHGSSSVIVKRTFKKESSKSSSTTSTTEAAGAVTPKQIPQQHFSKVIVPEISSENSSSSSKSLENFSTKDIPPILQENVPKSISHTEEPNVIVHQISKDSSLPSTVDNFKQIIVDPLLSGTVTILQKQESKTTSHTASKSNQSPTTVITQQSTKKKAVRTNTSSLQKFKEVDEQTEILDTSIQESQPLDDQTLTTQPQEQTISRSEKKDHQSEVICHQISTEQSQLLHPFVPPAPGALEDQSGKVIIHQVLTEDSAPQQPHLPPTHIETADQSEKLNIHKITTEGLTTHQYFASSNQSNTTDQSEKVILHQITTEKSTHNQPFAPQHQENMANQSPKEIVHQISTEESTPHQPSVPRATTNQSAKVIYHQLSSGEPTPYQSIAALAATAGISDESRKVIVNPNYQHPQQQSKSRSMTFEEQQRVLQREHSNESSKMIVNPFLKEFSTQTSFSPLPTPPANLIFRQNSKEKSPEVTRFSPPRETESPSRVIIHPILQEKSTQTLSSQSQPEATPFSKPANGLEPLKVQPPRSAFPVCRSPKMIVHPIHREGSERPAFPLTTKSMEKLDQSSKHIANQILQDVSSELQSSFRAERETRAKEEVITKPLITAFPLSSKRNGFCEVDSNGRVIMHQIIREESKFDQSSTCGIDTSSQSTHPKPNGLDNITTSPSEEPKVIVHQISREDSKSTQLSSSESSTTSSSRTFDEQSATKTVEPKVIVHQISREESQPPHTDIPSRSSPINPDPTARSSASPPRNIIHQISQEQSNTTQSKSSTLSYGSPSGVGTHEPKVIVHQISREEETKDQSTQFDSLSKSPPEPKILSHSTTEQQTTSTPITSTKTIDHQTSEESTSSSSSSQGTIQTVRSTTSPKLVSSPVNDERSPNSSFTLNPADLANRLKGDKSDSSDAETLYGGSETHSEAEEEMHKGDSNNIPDEISRESSTTPTPEDSSPKVITHPIVREKTPPESSKVIVHPIVRDIVTDKPLSYRVESPQPDIKRTIVKKSKSFDDDDVVIQELSDTSSAGDTDNPPLVSEAESETDTLEAVDELSDTQIDSRILSVQTLPMDNEENDSSQASSKNNQDYKARRQQNRVALQSHFLPQFLAPIFLDSIKEENSDQSDCERRSECSDRTDHATNQGDLEDDVFLEGGPHAKKADAVFPKSNLDFSKKHKHIHTNVRPPKTSIIREEAPPPSVVEAKIIDQGSIEERVSSWSTDLTPESEAAEVVYIDSASSSVSDLLELDYSQGQPDDSNDVRIQTPTIDLESVNEMFSSYPSESNESINTSLPTQSAQPPPVKEDEIISEHSTLPPLTSIGTTTTLPSDTTTTPTAVKPTIPDEIILEKIETMSETVATTANNNNNDVAAAADHAQNSKANNPNSCDSAINEVVTSDRSSATIGYRIEKMENIREIVSASVKSELETTVTDTDRNVSKPLFKIGEPCSDYVFKSDTKTSSSSLTSSSSTTITTTPTITANTTSETQILTLHELSKKLDDTKHLHPLGSSSSALDRQESLDSHCSDQSHSTTQSQCTAINQGSLPHCDWNEVDTTTDTTYVSESDTAGLASSENSSPLTTGGARANSDTESPPIRKLRSLCTEALASMPFGEEVLEELASVAHNIGDMPYPLPELPHIQDIQVSLRSEQKPSVINLTQVPPNSTPVGQKFKSPPPPPVPAPPSKYDDSWLGVPTQSDPSVLVCLSPSQRGAVKDNATPDSLLDMHKKFVERRGYHEYSKKEVSEMNKESSYETVTLSKSGSSPPPPPPPRPQPPAAPTPAPAPPKESRASGNETLRETNINDDDQNNHRLLAIIRDTHETQQQQQQQKYEHHHEQKSSTTSLSENTSRRTESAPNTINTTTTTHTINTTNANSGGGQEEFAGSPSVSKQTQERYVSESNKSQSAHYEMQTGQSERPINVENEPIMGLRFPSSDYFDSIFHEPNKRFSNIETGPSEGFCSQILNTQPKRYSNVETSSIESRKCIENGKVLYDVTNSVREKFSEGDKQAVSERPDPTSFSKLKTKASDPSVFPHTAATGHSDVKLPKETGDSENIMSAFNLNTQSTVPPQPVHRAESSPPAPPVPPLPSTLIDTTATTTSTKSTSTSESVINRNFNGETKEKIFDDFRQRAKEAAAGNQQRSTMGNSTSTPRNSEVFVHEKLLKDFDELSNLLKDELESGKRRPPATLDGSEIPTDVCDYNRVAREAKIQTSSHTSSTTTTEETRREQMKKLADEIDRTAIQRQQQRKEKRIPIYIEKSTPTPPRHAPQAPKSAPATPQAPRTYEIPVHVEKSNQTVQQSRSEHQTLKHQRSYEIPIRVEHQTGTRQRTYSEHEQPERYRRAESMFNISESSSQHRMLHDDWMKYVGDLGSSENICKPFQREVEICYMGRRPNIRAPRLSASTSDLSSNSYDTYGAYDVRRSSTSTAAHPQQPPPQRRYLSTQSMIDTTPITSCVSNSKSPIMKRRSSLPREIHDQQMNYITSKEHQLKLEFERLENERRALIDEMNRAQINQRLNREAFRQRQLPPLTEDESFRQQMAQEWLNKVAEREERRLQKIIKISKVNQEANLPAAPPRGSSSLDIGDEFLSRVKERRSKLHMPSDSDWESGAESQPVPRNDGSRSENENEDPPMTVLEGQSEADIKRLPKHLREFAKLSSQVKEEHREETTENTSCSAHKKSSYTTTIKTSNVGNFNNNSSSAYESSQSYQQDADRVRDLEQLSQGKRQKLVTILRHKKPAEGSSSCHPVDASAGATLTTGTSNTGTGGGGGGANSVKRRKQTRFLLTPNRRSWSESDLLSEIDKELVLAKGFLYANGVWIPKNQTPSSSRTNLNDDSQQENTTSTKNNNNTPTTAACPNKFIANRSEPSNCEKGVPIPPPPPLWTPQPERKQFRAIHFESPTLQRKYVVRQQSTPSEAAPPPWSYTNSLPFPGYQSQSCTNLSQRGVAIPWPPAPTASSATSAPQNGEPIVTEPDDDDIDNNNNGDFPPTTSIAEKIRNFERSNSNTELRRPFVRHNPHEKPAILRPNEVIYSVKNEYMSEPETEYEKPKRMAQLSRRQYDGIGPTTRDGMPVVLRSEVKEPNQHEWYKRIFQTIHKQKNPDDYVTIRYKCPRGRYPYKSNGYMSEPEPNYDSDYSTVKYRTLERRRLQSTGTGTGTDSGIRTHTEQPIVTGPSASSVGNDSQANTFYGTMPNPVKSGQGSYKVQPGRIENYVTGHSSVSEKEKKEWWDEVMDIFNGWLIDNNNTLPRIFIEFANEVKQFQLDQQKLSPHYTEGNLSRALLKEQGYTSDSNIVFRKKDVYQQSPLSPVEQKQVYKSVQAGGQPPLLGFRKPAPEKPKETEFEYLPITPTLTKIRVHSKEAMSKKSQTTQRELICYPITNVSRPIDMFAPFPKHVPSFIPMNQPPLPPNRKSSRARATSMALKISSSSEMKRPTSANSSRHEACFRTKDAISPPPPRPSKYATITLRKTVKRTEPLVRSKSAGAVVGVLTAAKEQKTEDGRVSRKQQTIRLNSCSPVRSVSRVSTLRTSSRSPVAFGRSVSKERCFAEEKKRIEETLPSIRTDFTASTNILRDPTLRSPDQVKRAVRSYAIPMERSKSAPRVLSPSKPASSSYMSTYVIRRVPSPTRKEMPTTKRAQTSTSTRSPFTVRSKSQSAKLSERTTSKSMTKTSSTISLARTNSTFSVDSTASKAKPAAKKPLTISRLVPRTETEKPKRKPVTISSSKSDSNVLKKIKESSAETKAKIVKAIPSQQKVVRTNQFFTNLFMRDSSPKKEQESSRHASVVEKTRYWNTMSLPTKRTVVDTRRHSYQQCRSLSPNYVEEYRSVEQFQSDDEGSEFGDRSGRTEDLVWQYEQRSRSEPRGEQRLVRQVSDIARPESPAPVFPREFSPTREIRVPQTREMRSPSRRRIQSFRGSQRGETGKVIRASSLSSADDRSKRSLYNCDEISHSANSLEYIERHSPSWRFRNSDRFIDLNRFYSTLERVGQLERATSATNLKPIRKEGEPIDFEEWRKIRFHERAERELNYLVGRLKEDQKQKDFLFRPKDVEDVKWSENKDLSLRSKDKSVEDLRENFEKKIHEEWLDESKRWELESKKDTYKPYWRGSSVADLASSMEIKYNSESGSYGVQKVKGDTTAEKPLCLSNRLISTLSKDQVSKITQQLNEIYNASEPKAKPDVTEEYVITVDKHIPANALKVRCNSTISKEELIGPVLRRKEAHEKPAQTKIFDRHSQNVSKFDAELTESEKRKLSQTFSREIQGKARSDSPVLLARETRGAIAAENAKSTLPDLSIPLPPPLPKDLIQTKKIAPETKKLAPAKPIRKDIEEKKKKPDDNVQGDLLKIETTTNETIEKPEDTISKKIQYFEDRKFEEPAKTIYHAREDSSPDEDEVMRVIEENIKARAQSTRFHHQELSSSATDLKDLFGEREASRINFPLPRPPPPPDETIYHESHQDQHRSTSLTLSASHDGSLENLETLFRSRSISPQTSGTSYLQRVYTGEVQKIKDKFESLGRPKKKGHFFGISPLRKVRSDPELSNDGSKDTFKTIVGEHEVGDVSWITHKFELQNSATRGRSRFRNPGSPIQRMPLRKEDRLMPHIDIISKTASLKQEMMKSRSPSPTRQQQASFHAGEVERIRCLFETSPDRESPVGQPRLGTSSPELRDISAHLTASWIAHKYPKPLDNDLRSPPPQTEKLEKSVSLPIQEVRRNERIFRSRSISPPKTKQKQQLSTPVTSILKPRYDFFANQKFDPSIHRPKARYVPDSIDDPWKKAPPIKKTSAVKFKDSEDVPPPPVPPVPPTKGVPLDSNGFNNLESPNRYFESDVNIHYKTPIRYEYKDPIPEEELVIRQAESMQKLYQEERRRKYLQELQDMNARRHTDNFTPSQKSPIPLNRYDDFNSDLAPKSPNSSSYPKTIARALYNFQGQTARELTFKKGDVIYIRRQIDKNWYEGEHNAMIGLLPSNYVELVTKDGIRQPPKKPSEGQARAKYNFQAQSGIELSLNKGEHVTLTRRVDDNWYEGKIANRKGIFPVSYVEVLVDIGAEDKARTPASQTIITTQTSSMRPSLDTLRTNINNEFNSLTSNGQHPNGILRETKTQHKTEVLHVDTNTEPVAYRSLYKYRPQNTDELELQEGDIVYVLEKCDDGWFVGTSQRTGCFGTFPGNYVERV